MNGSVIGGADGTTAVFIATGGLDQLLVFGVMALGAILSALALWWLIKHTRR